MATRRKRELEAQRVAERQAIENQLPSLRAERRKLRDAGKDYTEVDGKIRQLVKRSKRIENKLNPRSKEGIIIKAKASEAKPSAPIYKTYRAASQRPVQGGRTSSR